MNCKKCPCITSINADGTSQYQRMLKALDPSFAPIHDFDIKDWMLFAFHFSKNLNYYSPSDNAAIHGDWSDFIIEEAEIKDFITSLKKKLGTVEPHIALFVCFLKLMQFHHRNLNKTTRRHLDFYYKRVLKLSLKPFSPDKVHIIFSLAKNITSHTMKKGSGMDAGKDKDKQKLSYITNDELTIYPATISELKTLYHQKNKAFRYAETAKSSDGLGAELDENNPTWYPFGNKEQQIASMGFALVSKILLLKEGDRTISVTLTLKFPDSGVKFSKLAKLDKNMSVYLTGEKEWIKASAIKNYSVPSSANQTISFDIEVDTSIAAITAYDSSVHGGNYYTDLPIIRFLFEMEKGKTYKEFIELAKAKVESVKLKAIVKGLTTLTIENDNGTLDSTKAFMPFGPVPKKGGNLYISNDEIFNKKWTKITINTTWKDKPGSLKNHYIAYRKEYIEKTVTYNDYDITYNSSGVFNAAGTSDLVTSDAYFKVDISTIEEGTEGNSSQKGIFSTYEISKTIATTSLGKYECNLHSSLNTQSSNLYVQSYLGGMSSTPLFDAGNFNPGFTKLSSSTGSTVIDKNNCIKISLVNDFLHKHYPVLYSLAMLRKSNKAIPKEPYSPMIDSISIDYEAEVENTFKFTSTDNTSTKILEDYRKRDIQLFHIQHFGQSEQHRFLIDQHNFLTEKNIYVLPRLPSEGEFYIGLKDATVNTITSILFQVSEGSENPLSPSFTKNKKIEWYALCNNEWMPLTSSYIKSDSTNNFLKSGIIRFLLPKGMNDTNSLFSGTYHWIMARLPAGIQFDSVCKFHDVLAQAVEAQFSNNKNELSHLQTGIAAKTISKLTDKPAEIKSLSQPYSSFDGLPKETDDQFYTRVSERLRHKNRAVSMWDHEHLILQEFPSIFKVKCLNHSSSQSDLAPGHVKIVPIPDLRNKNIYNILQPRVSKNMLSEIETFIMDLSTLHLVCKVENPDFEEIKFKFDVKFYDAYDPNTYLNTIKDDIKKFLAPWAYDSKKGIYFGGQLYKSQAITYLEGLKYVDYISNFQLYNLNIGEVDKSFIKTIKASSILTSASDHDVNSIDPPVCP